MEVTALDRTEPSTLNSELVETLGARYESTRGLPLSQAAERYGPFDIIFEATGTSSVAFEAMEALGKNGVLVLTGISGGDRTRVAHRRPAVFVARLVRRQQVAGR